MIATIIGMTVSIDNKEVEIKSISHLPDHAGVKLNARYAVSYEQLAEMVDTGILPTKTDAQ